ncbi:MAG: sigma-70 family RNA polymerase sigma factor [Nannocystaceae bacterium]|nr:sigma-70 family RNA polymerase sigma factor [Nannocystaceae bacterium]
MDPGPAPRTDGELLAAWGQGDRVAATELVDRYYRSVLRFFDLRVGGAAEDLTQRTFLACVEGRERLREAESFRPFLFGIARRLLLNHLRTRVVESNVFDDGDVSGATDPAPTASRIVAGYEQQTLLLRAMQLLDVEAQMLLVLFYWEGLKTSEISQVLGAPVSTITTRLSRTRKALQDAIAALPAVPGSRDSLLADLDAWLGSVRGLELGS